MYKPPLYAVSYEDNEGGGVHRTMNSFPDAVYFACKLFGELLPYEDNPARFLAACEKKKPRIPRSRRRVRMRQRGRCRRAVLRRYVRSALPP